MTFVLWAWCCPFFTMVGAFYTPDYIKVIHHDILFRIAVSHCQRLSDRLCWAWSLSDSNCVFSSPLPPNQPSIPPPQRLCVCEGVRWDTDPIGLLIRGECWVSKLLILCKQRVLLMLLPPKPLQSDPIPLRQPTIRSLALHWFYWFIELLIRAWPILDFWCQYRYYGGKKFQYRYIGRYLFILYINYPHFPVV